MSLESLNIPLYCINLYDRTDRHRSLVKEFANKNLPYTLYQALRHPMGGTMGCKTSWLNTLRMSYDLINCNSSKYKAYFSFHFSQKHPYLRQVRVSQ